MAFAMGAAVESTVLLVFGWVPVGDLSFKIILIAFLNVSLVTFRFNDIKEAVRKIKVKNSLSPSYVDLVALFLVGGGLLLSFITCFSPITYYDSLVYHIGLPKIYLQEGRVFSVPFNLYSQFPGLMEMLFMFCLRIMPDSETSINLLTWFMSLGTSVGIYQWLREHTNSSTALWGMVIWWTMPVVLFLSIGAYVDVPLAFFTLLAVRAFASFKSERKTSWLILSGIFCSAAISVKYTGGISIVILGFFLLVGIVQKKSDFKSILIFSAASVSIFGFWLIKNAIEVGNPVFPFFFNVFGGNVGWTSETSSQYFQALTDYGMKSQLFFDLIRDIIPFKLSFLPTDGMYDALGDLGWPLILLLAPLSVMVKKNKDLRFILIYTALHFSLWFILKPVYRFLVGALPFLIFSSLVFYNWLGQRSHVAQKGLTIVFILPFIIYNLFLFFSLNQDLQLFSVALGAEPKKEFLSRRLAYYPSYDLLNRNSSQLSRVLLVGEQRTYHLNVSVSGSNIFAPSQIAMLSNNADSSDDLRNDLRALDISHILVLQDELQRLGGMKKLGFSIEGEKHFGQMLAKNAQLISMHQNSVIYAMTD